MYIRKLSAELLDVPTEKRYIGGCLSTDPDKDDISRLTVVLGEKPRSLNLRQRTAGNEGKLRVGEMSSPG